MTFEIEDIIKKVKNNYATIIVVNLSGDIVDCHIHKKEISTKESFEILNGLYQKHKDCSAKILLQDKNATREILRTAIKDCVEGIKYAQSHKMKPGTNIPYKL